MLGTVGELAERVGGRVLGDQELQIARITAIDEAVADALTFATSPAYFEAALGSKAGAILVDETLLQPSRRDTPAKPLIVVSDARAALAELLRAFEPPRKRGPFRHATAVVEEGATIGADVFIGAHAIVSKGALIGARSVLEAGAYVGSDSILGADSLLYPYACILDGCVVGERAVLHTGAVIGGEGFGFIFIGGKYTRIPQVGNVVLGDDVEIGAHTCIDRAQTGSTLIGEGTKIDNLCQIGHNCRIGRHMIMAAQAGLAGSTNVGEYVMFGGKSAAKGHVTIGSRVRIAGGATIWKDIPDDMMVSGSPARPHQAELRREVMVRNLPKLVARVEALEKRKQ